MEFQITRRMENLKEHSLRALLVVGVLLGIAAGAHAQSLIVAKVPFDFMVSGMKLPAGTYGVDALQGNADTLVVHSSDWKLSAAAIVAAGGEAQSSANPKLVFHRYGDEYFLSAVRSPERVYPLGVSRPEQRLAKARGQNNVSISGAH
jgi:hypothetical protein